MKRCLPIQTWDMSTAWRNRRGYWMVWAPDHPKAIRGYYYLHRLVMEKVMGRILESYEEVHHLLSGKGYNEPDGLVVVHRHEHLHAHKILGG